MTDSSNSSSNNTNTNNNSKKEVIVAIKDLTFSYKDKEDYRVFSHLSYNFYSHNCYVICGRNGSGKSTLLELIAGKKLAAINSISVDGIDPFRNTRINGLVSFLNNQWGMRTVAYCGYNLPLQSSIKVCEMMNGLKRQYPDREKTLREVLDINPEWALNNVSEGQRKRIQLYLGLLRPVKVLLLDEITVNIDVIIKARFLDFLKSEARNGVSVLYVTHIFDGLEDWCDYVLYLNKDSNNIQGDQYTRDSVNKIRETPIDSIPDRDIYKYVLDLFIKSNNTNDTDKEKPEEANVTDITKGLGNAGGYANGTLNNLVL